MPSSLLARSLRALPFLLLACAVPACTEAPVERETAPLGEESDALTTSQRMARYKTIRTACTANGIIGRGYMFAGIAYDETGLAQCWSEATWACKGPKSPDCGGGPVIAGAADGPCSDEQGGLGMFQFDAGTYSQTIAAYGSDVLTVSGQVKHAIAYVIHMVKISVYTTNAETDAKAKAWINAFDPKNAKLRDEWIKTVVRYYNGCPEGASCWDSRYKTYNEGLTQVLADTNGTAWWAPPPPDWSAKFVSQTLPLASQPFDLYPGDTKKGTIELKNTGAKTWEPGQVFLGTTEPRDMKSKLASPDWVSPSRAATVEKATPPGSIGQFTFTVTAPSKAGNYPQHFNLVREGVAWFSDPGEGGPKDDLIEVSLTVKPEPATGGSGGTGGSASGGSGGSSKGGAGGAGGHGGFGGAGAPSKAGGGGVGGAGATAKGGSAGSMGGAALGGEGGSDGTSVPADEGAPVVLDGSPEQGGGCSIGEGRRSSTSGLVALLGLVAIAARRGRRAPRETADADRRD